MCVWRGVGEVALQLEHSNHEHLTFFSTLLSVTRMKTLHVMYKMGVFTLYKRLILLVKWRALIRSSQKKKYKKKLFTRGVSSLLVYALQILVRLGCSFFLPLSFLLSSVYWDAHSWQLPVGILGNHGIGTLSTLINWWNSILFENE